MKVRYSLGRARAPPARTRRTKLIFDPHGGTDAHPSGTNLNEFSPHSHALIHGSVHTYRLNHSLIAFALPQVALRARCICTLNELLRTYEYIQEILVSAIRIWTTLSAVSTFKNENYCLYTNTQRYNYATCLWDNLVKENIKERILLHLFILHMYLQLVSLNLLYWFCFWFI